MLIGFTNKITSTTTIAKKLNSITLLLIVLLLLLTVEVSRTSASKSNTFTDNNSINQKLNNNNIFNNNDDINIKLAEQQHQMQQKLSKEKQFHLEQQDGEEDKHHEKDESSSECKSSLGCSQQTASVIILLFLVMLFLSILVVYAIIKLDLHFIPESIAVILFGVVLGFIGKYAHIVLVTHVEEFNPELFFLFLLPCIIFETGFSVHRVEFFKNITPILALATIGTLISFLGTAFGLFAVGKLGVSLKIPILDSLLFGSIACATDPVATLGIFKALDVDSKLYMIVLGESILNDAVSLILFKAVNTYSLHEIWKPLLLFFGISIGSVVLGVAIALLISLILKWMNIGKYPAIETLFVIIFAYISYLLADALNLSGILSTFFCGMAFQQYGFHSLSSDSKHNCTQLLRMGAFVCETIAFIYIGVSLPLHTFSFNLTFFIWSIVFIILFRAIAVFPIIGLLNRFGFSSIPFSIQAVVFLSGLRGAISFSLSMSEELQGPFRPQIMTTILLLVYFTIFVFGLSTYPALKAFKIKSSDIDVSLDFIGQPLHVDSRFSNIGSLFYNLNEKYFNGWFIRGTIQFSHNARNKDIDIHISDGNVYQDINNTIEMDSVGKESSETDSPPEKYNDHTPILSVENLSSSNDDDNFPEISNSHMIPNQHFESIPSPPNNNISNK